MEMKFLRKILNKTKEERKRNTNTRLELGVDEIKNYIQNSRFRWFGHVMWMREERIPKNMLHTKMEGKRPRGRRKTTWIDQIRKDIEMRGENWEQIQENRKWEHRDR